MSYQIISAIFTIFGGFVLLFFREGFAAIIVEQNRKYLSSLTALQAISKKSFARINLIAGICTILYGVFRLYPMIK